MKEKKSPDVADETSDKSGGPIEISLKF